MLVNKYVPEILSNDSDYKVFLSIIDQVNSDIKHLIDVYPELVDIDNCEVLFIPKLTELLHYKLNFNIDNNIKREIIKRIINVYKNRGTDDSIITAATYGDNPLWVGDHVFLPGNLIKDINAELLYPTTTLFRHDISKFSGNNKYPDGVKWRSGVIIIKVARLNDKIKKAILNVIPAGLKAYIEIDTSIGKYVDIVYFSDWEAKYLWYTLDYSLSLLGDNIHGMVHDFSAYSSNLSLSGRKLLYRLYDTDYYLADRIYDSNLSSKVSDLLTIVNNPNKNNRIESDLIDRYITVNKVVYNVTKSYEVDYNLTYLFNKINIDRLLADSDYYIADRLYDSGRSSKVSDLLTIVNNPNKDNIVETSLHSALLNVVEIDEVAPSDVLYPVKLVESMHEGDYLKDYAESVEYADATNELIEVYDNKNYEVVLND